MPKKATDPFMCALWNALAADALGPGGQQTGWAETPVRIRNRFTRAVRQVLQSGAAFQASTMDVRMTRQPTPRPAAKRKGKPYDPRELQLPLMGSVQKKDR